MMNEKLLSKLTFRLAEHTDLPRLTEIYNQAIDTGRCTGDLTRFLPEQRSDWFLGHSLEKRMPLYVAVLEGVVIGYSSIDSYRQGRAAFAQTCIISYYLDFGYHGQGIGTALAKFVIGEAKKLNYTTMLAIVLDCNNASIALAESLGFKRWGFMCEVGIVGGKACSHIYFGLKLSEVHSD